LNFVFTTSPKPLREGVVNEAIGTKINHTIHITRECCPVMKGVMALGEKSFIHVMHNTLFLQVFLIKHLG
jgi:hypothetical protein